LLGEREQALFGRLAVFAGGCTLEAAAAVCGLGEDDLIDALAALVENSLLLRQERPQQPEPRFSMLETIGEYAVERLAETSEDAELRSRHAAYFTQLAEVAYAQRLDDEAGWSARLEAEHDNLRAALDFVRLADPPRHLHLAGALGWFWDAHAHLREGRERLEAATAHADEVSVAVARAVRGAGVLACSQGDTAAAFDQLGKAISLWQELGDPLERALTLRSLALAHFFAGEMQASAERAEESFALLRELERPKHANRAQLMLAHALVAQLDVARAAPLAEQGLSIALAGDDPRSAYVAYHVLGDCALVRGDGARARERYLDSLRTVWDFGDRFYACYELDHLAVAEAACGDARRGLRLAAAAAAHLDVFRTEVDKVAFWAELRERHLGRARSELGTRAEAVWEEGRRLSLERAVEEALTPLAPVEATASERAAESVPR
jgi:tetratricopeptide (TPR) repeat protein